MTSNDDLPRVDTTGPAYQCPECRSEVHPAPDKDGIKVAYEGRFTFQGEVSIKETVGVECPECGHRWAL